jgi:hypothetical protein
LIGCVREQHSSFLFDGGEPCSELSTGLDSNPVDYNS